MAPDEAFGAIFPFDGIIADNAPVHKLAWTKVAEEMNLTMPDDDDVRRAMGMPTEIAIQRVMYWTNDWGDTKRIAFRKAELFFENFQGYNHTVEPETRQWLQQLKKSSIPICICSEMDRNSVNSTLMRMGLKDCYDELVSAEDDFDTRSQMYLNAAIKLNRPPQFCVVCVTDPEGISASRDISAQCVAVLGRHAAYELQSADLTVRDLSELTTYNLRRLFSQVGEGNNPELEPQLEMETQPSRRRRGPWGGGYEDDGDEGAYVVLR
mmetsp:Transcript_31877/g.49852  ORF Transcript_31877/g.49852 Transcript_31877/m.49852 type:complete len:266 (-) Transcript_31877:661-1458(-)